MATVRHLGLFSLPNLFKPFGKCPQPAEAFTLDIPEIEDLGLNPATCPPATIPQSTYVNVGLQRAMLWLWRVKKFQAQGTLDVYYSNDPDPPIQYSVTFGPFDINNVNIASETNKVCDCGGFYGFEQSANYGENGSTGDYSIAVEIASRQEMWINYPKTPRRALGLAGQRLRKSLDNKFFIPVLINVDIIDANQEQSLTNGSDSAVEEGEDKPLSWQIADSLGSISKPFRYGSSSITGTFEITPSEYWPYDPNDGLGPIYDSTTGEQLRPFPA
jgi:hypothetical protein